MTYQNVGTTPRFYVSILQWLKAIGKLEASDSTMPGKTPLQLVDINPTYQMIINLQTSSYGWRDTLEYHSLAGNFSDIMPANNFQMWLGHNFSTTNPDYELLILTRGWSEAGWVWIATGETGLVNYENQRPEHGGFTLATYNDNDTVTGDKIQADMRYGTDGVDLRLGSYLYGTFYDMPVAPDLSLSMEHDYSGIRKTTSMSGASFSNANWSSPPKWGDKEAWQLGDFPRPYSGRRIWDLSFSYVSDSDLEPRNYTGTTEATPPQQGDANWFENVLNYTMGHLPFIFQPNKDAAYTWTDEDPAHITEIPEFAICRFDMDSFTREQVAPGVYNIKIKIKETW